MPTTTITKEQIFGQNVTKERARLKLTVNQLATNIGMDIRAMKAIENGTGQKVDPRLISLMSEVFKCNGEDLLIES
jgi:DNA-binding XRE family transcriptional regulator